MPPRAGQRAWSDVSERPEIIIDGAHNPAGTRALAAYIRRFYSGRRIWLVYGALRDKAVAEMTSILFPLADRVILTAPANSRAMPPEDIPAPGAHLTHSIAEAIALLSDVAARRRCLHHRFAVPGGRGARAARKIEPVSFLRAYLITAPLIILATVAFGLVSLIISLFDTAGRKQIAVARAWARFLLWGSGVKVKVEGLEKIAPDGSYVFASNHLSYMDTPVVLANIPVQFRFLAKSGLFQDPAAGHASGYAPDTSPFHAATHEQR